MFSNEFFTVNDLELSTDQKKQVLMWLARKLFAILQATANGAVRHGKHYDPLTIVDDNKALSYVFDLENGGRQHNFRDFLHLEDMLMGETVQILQQRLADSG